MSKMSHEIVKKLPFLDRPWIGTQSEWDLIWKIPNSEQRFFVRECTVGQFAHNYSQSPDIYQNTAF